MLRKAKLRSAAIMAANPNSRILFLALMEPFALMPAGAARKACVTIIVLVSAGSCDLGMICAAWETLIWAGLGLHLLPQSACMHGCR